MKSGGNNSSVRVYGSKSSRSANSLSSATANTNNSDKYVEIISAENVEALTTAQSVYSTRRSNVYRQSNREHTEISTAQSNNNNSGELL